MLASGFDKHRSHRSRRPKRHPAGGGSEFFAGAGARNGRVGEISLQPRDPTVEVGQCIVHFTQVLEIEILDFGRS